MFTVEDQTTRGLSRPSPGQLAWRWLSRLGQRPRSLAIRVGRRGDWLLNGLTARKAANLAKAAGACLAKRAAVRSWPVFILADLSPACNLHCTVCLHAHADGNPDLERQRLQGSQRMSVANYARLIDEIKDYSLGVVLWYLGDPIVYPELLEVCRITGQAGLNSHVSTNFSRPLSDDWIAELIRSGLTYLTVCVDGWTQETFEKTRVGGNLACVVSNLRRACAIRRKLRQRFPRIEVQYIKYQHNLHEFPAACRALLDIGVDNTHELWGWLHNYTDRDPGKYSVFRPRRAGLLPRCHWPHLFTIVKCSGDVVPCWSFRLGEQYTEGGDARAIGNAFETSLWDVWTSPAYEQVRRLACDPMLSRQGSKWAECFCDSCPRLFASDFRERTCRYANEHRWEEFYETGPQGRTIRLADAGPPHAPHGAT